MNRPTTDLRQDAATTLTSDLMLREQCRLIDVNFRAAIWASAGTAVMLALTLGLVLHQYSDSHQVIQWLAMLLGCSVLLDAALVHTRRRAASLGGHAHVIRLSLISALLGSAWALVALLFFRHDNVLMMAVELIIMAGICSGSLATLSASMVVYLAFTTPIALAVYWIMLSHPEPAIQLLSAPLTIYLVFMAYFSRNFEQAARTSIALRFENLQLIGQLRHETGQAQQARRHAEEANLAKSRFLAAASHDLRQPLHAQGLFIEALRHEHLPERARVLIERSAQAAEGARQMLNTLLDFSRIDAGVVAARPQPFALQPLLARIERELGPQADAKGLVWRTVERDWVVASDPVMVEMILRNLIGNAIRYTSQGGILIGSRRRGDAVSVEIWDTGCGIPAEAHEDIFREFHQLGNPERDRQKGLGLGLSIARGLSLGLGQPLTLDSRPGHGSVFRLRLPLARADVAAMELPRPPAPAAQGPLSATILLVDDDPDVRDSLQAVLLAWGCDCLTAGDLDSAVAVARERRFDALIVDWRLPAHQTGGDVIRALREQIAGTWPTIVITGDTAPDRLREAAASGATLLHKPIDAQLLRDILSRLLGPA